MAGAGSSTRPRSTRTRQGAAHSNHRIATGKQSWAERWFRPYAFGACYEGRLGGFGAGWTIDLVLMLVRSAFVLWLIALMAATITMLSRSVAAGIALGIVWLTMEPLAGRLLDNGGAVAETVRMLLISTNVEALTSANGFGSQSVPDGLPGIWQATGLLLGYAVLLVLIAVSVFRARDITSGG